MFRRKSHKCRFGFKNSSNVKSKLSIAHLVDIVNNNRMRLKLIENIVSLKNQTMRVKNKKNYIEHLQLRIVLALYNARFLEQRTWQQRIHEIQKLCPKG